MDDKALIELYFRRSEQAISETAQKYGARLRGLAYNVLGSWEDADEVENDAYLALWKAIPPERPRFFFAYAAKICRHFAFDRLDRAAAQKRSAILVELTREMAECIPDPAASVERSLEQKRIGALLTRFLRDSGELDRAIFVRRYWLAEPVETLAKEIGISRNAAVLRLHRLRKKLKEYLEHEGVNL